MSFYISTNTSGSETLTHLPFPTTKPNARKCAQNIRLCRCGSLGLSRGPGAWGTSLPEAQGPGDLAKVSGHICALFGSKWLPVKYQWSADLLSVVGGFRVKTE